MKKSLSILLAFIMVLSIFTVIPFSVSAGKLNVVESGSESTGNSTFDAFISDSRWKSGIAWNGDQGPKISPYGSSGCCAYAADFAKYCYNSNNPTSGEFFTSISDIRAGDVLYITGHWLVCLKRSGNSLYTAEGNFTYKGFTQTRVGWNYDISGSNLVSGDFSRKFEKGYHFGSAPDPKPSNPWIKVSNNLISPGGTVTFTFGADNATHYTIGIDKEGSRIITQDVSSGKSYTFTEEGDYTTYVTCKNSAGSIDSAKVSFSVYNIADLGYSFYAEITRAWDGMAVTDDNRNLALYSNNHNENQLWRFVRQSDGSYMIYNLASCGYIDLASSNPVNNTNIQVIIKHDVDAQHWYIIDSGTGYRFASKKNVKLCIDSKDNRTDEGTNLELYQYWNHDAQKFTICKTNKITLNDGISDYSDNIIALPIDKVNEPRLQGDTVVYDSSFGATSGTNVYGGEKSFDKDGKLVEIRGYGDQNQINIPTYGFVLSLNSHVNGFDNVMSEEYKFAFCDFESNQVLLFKNESDYLQYKLVHQIGSRSFFSDDVYVVQATNVNEGRGAGATVIYTSNYGANTGTNMYGNEAGFDAEGKLVSTRDWGNTTPLDIPTRGFVMSEHSGGEGYQKIVNEGYIYGYCNYEQRTIILFKNKTDYEIGKRLFRNSSQNYGELPVPKREGFVFDGWYTEPDGGNRVGADTPYAGIYNLYAHWKKIEDPTQPTDMPQIILGDADGDGNVTIFDATTIQRHLVSLPTQSFIEDASDCDGDGSVTVLDATAIQRHLASLPTQAKGIGEPI